MPKPIRISSKSVLSLARALSVFSFLTVALMLSAGATTPSRDAAELPTLLEAREVVQVEQHEEVRTEEATRAADEPTSGVKVPRTNKPRPGFLDFLFGRAAMEGRAEEGPAEIEMDARMIEAAHLAQRAARRSSINRCWRYVKRALQAAQVVACYPQTALAKQAAVELPERYGFARLEVEDPFEAPVGAVLVYGGRGAGHVEIRTEDGFVSDHASLKPSPRPLIGVFVKPLEG
jgi:hypothetical protein